jgi:hypothetical protein
MHIRYHPHHLDAQKNLRPYLSTLDSNTFLKVSFSTYKMYGSEALMSQHFSAEISTRVADTLIDDFTEPGQTVIDPPSSLPKTGVGKL